MSTIWNVSGWDMAELAKKMQRLNPFMKLAQHFFVFLDFWLYNLSWIRCVSQTWDIFSVCNLFHCRLWRCLNMCGFGWGNITDFILLVPMWCTIGWKLFARLVPSYFLPGPAALLHADATIKITASLNLGWSGPLICMVQTEFLGKQSGKDISTWQVESRSSVIFTS